MGWAGSGGGGGNMPQVASSQEVVMTTSGGLGEAETTGVVVNVIPREGRQYVQRPVQRQRLERLAAGQQLHAGAQGRGPAGAVRAHQRVRRQSDGRRPDRPGQALVLLGLPSGRGEEHGAGHVGQQERRQPERLDGRFRQDQAGVQRLRRAPGDHPSDVAGDAAQQVQCPLGRAVQRRELQRRRHRDADDRSARAGPTTSRRANPTPAGRHRFRAGSCWRPAGACTRRGTASASATTAPTTP